MPPDSYRDAQLSISMLNHSRFKTLLPTALA